MILELHKMLPFRKFNYFKKYFYFILRKLETLVLEENGEDKIVKTQLMKSFWNI
jgi:hypothetical protein